MSLLFAVANVLNYFIPEYSVTNFFTGLLGIDLIATAIVHRNRILEFLNYLLDRDYMPIQFDEIEFDDEPEENEIFLCTEEVDDEHF